MKLKAIESKCICLITRFRIDLEELFLKCIHLFPAHSNKINNWSKADRIWKLYHHPTAFICRVWITCKIFLLNTCVAKSLVGRCRTDIRRWRNYFIRWRTDTLANRPAAIGSGHVRWYATQLAGDPFLIARVDRPSNSLALKLAGFLEISSRKAVRFSEQIIYAKNIRAYFHAKWRLLFLYTSWKNLWYQENIARTTESITRYLDIYIYLAQPFRFLLLRPPALSWIIVMVFVHCPG